LYRKESKKERKKERIEPVLKKKEEKKADVYTLEKQRTEFFRISLMNCVSAN